ncbi:Uncharacterized protein PECH_000628 [Penicillium ucsense]|uniref:F-box domain-containing protein n=1 Tax=Penicillium ucsense TaxID=2839758 RepID=A0A8J8W066_9EURO|nr:Uncharacterized protein PECM_000684 [Penicillium ucsense]KAF7738361.1 Uncharacterized protein PECH_000628 [Penicillium ucsense]
MDINKAKPGRLPGLNQAKLDTMPYDLKVDLAKHLDAGSVKALRLTCRALYDAFSGPLFVPYLGVQRINFERENMESLIRLVLSERYPRVINELKFVVPFFDSSHIRRQATTAADAEIVRATEMRSATLESFMATGCGELLTFALKSLRAVKLVSIELAFCNFPQFRLGFDVIEMHRFGMRVSNIIWNAILSGGLRFRELIAFDATKPCSVSLWKFARMAETNATSPESRWRMRHIESFTMRVTSQQLIDEVSAGNMDQRRQLVLSFLRYLTQMPNLVILKLIIYNTAQGTNLNNFLSQGLVSRIQWNHLRSCTLGGLNVSAHDLTYFLRRHSHMSYLSLDRFILVTGHWDEVFRVIEAEMPNLGMIRLAFLMHNRTADNATREVNLFPIWESQTFDRVMFYSSIGHAYTRVGINMWVHTRYFDRDEINRGLEFWPLSPEGSGLHPDTIMVREQHGLWPY